MDAATKTQLYEQVLGRIAAAIEGQTDAIAIMSTVACELHHGFEHFSWTGFYRVVEPGLLRVGPYQGGHGCIEISFDRGVCGAAARSGQTQIVTDVRLRSDHIACSASTLSEIVSPIKDADGRVVAVLDVDCDEVGAFDDVDRRHLEQLCDSIGAVMS